MSNKDKVRMILALVFVAICAAGIGSSYWLGHDNEIEEASEEILDEIVEYELHLPENTINIDLTPNSKEK